MTKEIAEDYAGSLKGGRLGPSTSNKHLNVLTLIVSLCRESNVPLAVVESIVGQRNPALTRHYTHGGELAAGRAVAALPSVMGNVETVLASTETDGNAILLKALRIAKSITAANWQTKRAELLAVLT